MRLKGVGLDGWRRSVDIRGFRFGVERSTISHDGDVYLDRWILYVGLGTIRVHRFERGDRGWALHTHPWAFVTFPLRGYLESYWDARHRVRRARDVRPFRFHFRGLDSRHRVALPPGSLPVWTIVVTGRVRQTWGFYPHPDKFVPFREYIK